MAYSTNIIKDLKHIVTPLEAVEWLLENGYPIEVKNLGKKYVDIKCPNPDHADRKLGNCKISRGKYDSRPGSFCYCYACGRSFSSLDILNRFMDKEESVTTMAQISHCENILHKRKKEKNRVSKKVKETIGLALYPKYRVVKSVSDVKPENGYYEQEGNHYLIMENIKWNPWEDIDDETRRYLLREKAKEQMCNLGNLLIQISKNQLDPEIAEIIDNYPLKDIFDGMNYLFNECQKIYRRNGGKITDLNVLIKSQLTHILDAVS